MIAILMVTLIFLVPIDHYSWKDRTASSLYDDSNEISLSKVLLDDSYDEKPLYYIDQTVDHFDPDDLRTYNQRYYKKSKHFGGPGHPILLIMGGESALEPPMLYPYVHEGLASTFGAFVVSPEHRFYGNSQPVGDETPPSVPEMMATLTPDQALEDAVGLIQAVREVLDCHPDRSHPDYCPVITVSTVLHSATEQNRILGVLFERTERIHLTQAFLSRSLADPIPAFCRP
jgi:hypothetical protein